MLMMSGPVRRACTSCGARSLSITPPLVKRNGWDEDLGARCHRAQHPGDEETVAAVVAHERCVLRAARHPAEPRLRRLDDLVVGCWQPRVDDRDLDATTQVLVTGAWRGRAPRRREGFRRGAGARGGRCSTRSRVATP